MRCLETPAHTWRWTPARCISPPPVDEDLRSPYVADGDLDLRSWARDALVLALPVQIVCAEDCRGLCVVCGQDLNEDPDHEHEREPDPRWAKLSELKLDS